MGFMDIVSYIRDDGRASRPTRAGRTQGATPARITPAPSTARVKQIKAKQAKHAK